MFFRVRGFPEYDYDSDRDSLLNWEERLLGTDPYDYDRDSDNDGMEDGFEFIHALNPLSAADASQDADGDLLSNLMEARIGTSPRLTDSDGNGISDADEDHDYDGITTIGEIMVTGTDPRQNDSDGDGMNDGWEARHGFDPLVDNFSSGLPDQHPDADPDGDGLSNTEEAQLDTHPDQADSDGDGVDDKTEEQQGSNPMDINDKDPAPNGTMRVDIRFGDDSGSHSEKYRVKLVPLSGDTVERVRTNRYYGVSQTFSLRLPKGAEYRLELIHIGTSPGYQGSPSPDYDYTLTVTDDGSDPAERVIIEDPEGMTGNHNEGYTFFAEGKSATLTTLCLIPRADTHIPVNRNRKKAGVGETFTFSVVPASAAATNWRIETDNETNLFESDPTKRILTCSTRASRPVIKADSMSATLVCVMDVIEPTGISARKLGGMSSALSAAQARGIIIPFDINEQGAGMLLGLRLLPEDVSFSNLETLEIDKGTVNVSGYFEQIPQNALKHSPTEDWYELNILSEYTDIVACLKYPAPWSLGTYDWNIEVRWRVTSRDIDNNGEILENIVQNTEILDVFGKTKVTKFGHSDTRSPNDPL